ncbi:MAG: hypothetical protein ACR2KU_14060 [Gammaproteobacteria bacterium]|nr:hypothetical protein [Gammaproteobacteria bacterium]
MKSQLVLVTATAIAFAFGALSTASAGADAHMSKMKRMQQMEKHQKKMGTEKSHMGAVMGKKGMPKSGMGTKGGAAVKETATTPATKKDVGGEKGTDK